MAEANGYAKEPRNSVNRLRARGMYDYGTIHSLIDATPVLHVSFNSPTEDEPFPVILPMLGATGDFAAPDSDPASGPRSIYVHGHVASRMMKLPKAEGAADEGVPVCVAATLIDGLVLSYTPFHNSCNYRSAVAFGRAHAVTDEAERTYALTLITDNLLADRWADGRLPNKAEMTSTGILRVEIVSASAKDRVGGPNEERADLKNDELRDRCWTGVVPAYIAWGTPVPSKDNRVEPTPAYIKDYFERENEKAQRQAAEALAKTKK